MSLCCLSLICHDLKQMWRAAAEEPARRSPFFRQWFGSSPQQPQAVAASTAPQASVSGRAQQHAQTDRQATGRASHNTEWTWNLGGPSSSDPSRGPRQQQGSCKPSVQCTRCADSILIVMTKPFISSCSEYSDLNQRLQSLTMCLNKS